MAGIRQALRASSVGCALCLGLVVPTALASTAVAAPVLSPQTQQTIAELNGDGVFRPAEPDDGLGPDWLSTSFPRADGNTIVVVTPGTDDGTLFPRIQGLRAGRQTLIIDYPEALGPLVSGRSGAVLPIFAPGYDASRDVAIDNNLAVMRAFAQQTDGQPFVVYTGYSQGADALGDAAEAAVADGTIDASNSLILLISDPRSPWGLKAWADDHPVVGTVFELFGATSNGARDPGATGEDLPVTSVIVVGDPVANFQWRAHRPLSSLLVNGAGFIAIHSGLGEENYGNLIDYTEPPTTMRSRDGNTTYVVYQPKHHPLTLVAMILNDAVGLDPSESDIARWDAVNNAFYPLVTPTPSNAAVPVVDTTSPLVEQATSAASSVPPLVEQATSAARSRVETTAEPQITETAAGGRHRAPETTDSGSTPEIEAPTEGGRHRLTGVGRHSTDAEPSSDSTEAPTDASSTPDVSTPDADTGNDTPDSEADTETDTSSDSTESESDAA
ncbi:PE-PPE domain-containing protein [Gordonia sp. HS-NH1]|uniref:PE-PPE domain-containing protein n=1 Tax=Gordonia sp. HS-NH1 TaxID=1435068 RepID=UPI0006E378EA|nr:PE-PPE domain-containing protein [Gordonia sp. HS-NH1]